MTLPDHTIDALCRQGMVTPYDPELLNPASLDIRLGGIILIESAASTDLVPYPLYRHSMDEPYLLVPGQWVLAESEEVFSIPDDVCVEFKLKSSRAREGIDHALAGFGDPGWHDSRLTMELRNNRQLHMVPIWPGMRIGQMVFRRMESPPQRSYRETGRYNGDLTVQVSRG